MSFLQVTAQQWTVWWVSVPNSWEGVVITPARVRCLPVHSAVAKATELHNTNVAPWESQSGQTHPEVSASLVLEKGAAWELLGVSTGCRWVSFSLLHRENSLPRKALGFVQYIAVIWIFFGKTILFSVSFILMKNTYARYFFFSDHVFCIYSVTSSSCDCDYICHYSAASC